MNILAEAAQPGFLEYFYSVLRLLGGMGAFLIGFKLLGDNMEKIAGNKLKQVFNKTSDKKIVNVGMGAAATAVVQSSAVTTVMVIGFVNTGIMTLYQAAAIIMGANIGTTITAQIVALNAFDVSVIATVLTAVGMFMVMLCKKDNLKTAGYAIAGLGLVFVGLEFMSGAMSIFSDSDMARNLLEAVSNPFVLVFIGIALTALMQSSSALTSIIIVMASQGLIIGGGGNSVLFVILGSNIGSCVTAVISSIGANRNAKRACGFHLLFNVLGSIIFMIVLMSWPGFMDATFAAWFPAAATQIAMFHTFFNVACTLMFLPFTKYLVKLMTIILPDKKEDKSKDMTYMDKRFLRTPALAIGQLVKETYHMGDMAMESLRHAVDSFANKNTDLANKVLENNQRIQKLSNEIVDFLIQISASDASLSDEKLVNALHNNVSDIVRVAELADNITKYAKRTVSDNLVFSESVYDELKQIYDLICEQYELTKRIVLERDYSLLRESDRREDKIDSLRKTFINEHIERLNRGECRAESNSVFINLMSNLERIGDHLSYMAHSLDNV